MRKRDEKDGTATPAENADLDHSSDTAPETTRDDRHDQGVPMLQGDPREPVGPEDALGVGEKRGDYADRVTGLPHTSVALDGGGEPVRRWVNSDTGAAASEGDDGAVEVTVDYAPTSEVVPQAPRATERGQAGALKGGVETDPASPAGEAAARAA